MVDVLAERLRRVERVFSQGVSACRRGGPGIHERRLDHVVTRGAPPDEAPSVIDVHGDARVGIHAAGVIAEPIEHHVARDDGVDFDGVHVPRPEYQRREKVAPATRTDYQCGETRRTLHQVIRERGELVSKICGVRRVSCPLQNRSRGGRVDVHEERIAANALEAGAQRPVAVLAVVDRHA